MSARPFAGNYRGTHSQTKKCALACLIATTTVHAIAIRFINGCYTPVQHSEVGLIGLALFNTDTQIRQVISSRVPLKCFGFFVRTAANSSRRTTSVVNLTHQGTSIRRDKRPEVTCMPNIYRSIVMAHTQMFSIAKTRGALSVS